MSGPVWIVRLNRVDMITLSGVVTTSLAAVLVVSGDYWAGCGLLFIAMLGDALDGWLARAWGLSSEFGRYLDSFMDTLMYLVVPALLLYLWGLQGWQGLPLILMIACGSIRLSVFNQIGNISNEQGQSAYLGMPVFWSPFIVAGVLFLDIWLSPGISRFIAGLAITVFSLCMLWHRPFFKFSSLRQMVALTLSLAMLCFFAAWSL